MLSHRRCLLFCCPVFRAGVGGVVVVVMVMLVVVVVVIVVVAVES